jgi:hypothetical protein
MSGHTATDEIEVTREMIAAGIDAIAPFELLDLWEGYGDRSDFVSRIYRQMAKARFVEGAPTPPSS